MRISDWSSDVCSSDLGVHRCDAPTLSSGRDWQPEGRFLAALGQRRLLVTMNHIATSQPPCREPPETVLMGQDHRTLVLPRSQSAKFGLRFCMCAITASKIGRAHVELQSLMRISYAVFCLKKNTTTETK